MVADVQPGTFPTIPAAVPDPNTQSARVSRHAINVEFVELIADDIAPLAFQVFTLAHGNWTQV